MERAGSPHPSTASDDVSEPETLVPDSADRLDFSAAAAAPGAAAAASSDAAAASSANCGSGGGGGGGGGGGDGGGGAGGAALLPVPNPRPRPQLEADEHAIIVSDTWIQLDSMKMSDPANCTTLIHRIATVVDDRMAPIEQRMKLIIETATRWPRLWSAVRDQIQGRRVQEHKKRQIERKAAEKRAASSAAALEAQEEMVDRRRRRLLRVANTDDMRDEMEQRNA